MAAAAQTPSHRFQHKADWLWIKNTVKKRKQKKATDRDKAIVLEPPHNAAEWRQSRQSAAGSLGDWDTRHHITMERSHYTEKRSHSQNTHDFPRREKSRPKTMGENANEKAMGPPPSKQRTETGRTVTKYTLSTNSVDRKSKKSRF